MNITTRAIIAAGLMGLCGVGIGHLATVATTDTNTYQADHALIVQLVRANDHMQDYCQGWAALELKRDGSAEVVGHCK